MNKIARKTYIMRLFSVECALDAHRLTSLNLIYILEGLFIGKTWRLAARPRACAYGL